MTSSPNEAERIWTSVPLIPEMKEKLDAGIAPVVLNGDGTEHWVVSFVVVDTEVLFELEEMF